MSERRHPNVVHVDEVPHTEQSRGRRYALRRKQLGAAAAGKRLGCSLIELPPGKRAWPIHWHAANEEAIFVLEGRGRMRIGEREVEVRAGDYVALPPGPAHAHQSWNDSEAPLRYLCFSTMIEPDMSVYPVSQKVGIFAGAAPGGDHAARTLDCFVPLAAQVDYWSGEEPDEK
jgi:uncharacterized cupin superfamily protein